MSESVRKITAEECSFAGYGVIAADSSRIFSISADIDAEVSLLLYKKGTDDILEEFPMQAQPQQGNMRSIRVRGAVFSRYEYNYRINGKIVVDPAALLVTGRASFGDSSPRGEHQIKGGFPAFEEAFPDQGGPDIDFTQIISCYLHVRGFTMGKNSHVRHRGTFQGLQEKIPYLQQLGINQVILMPAYEFEEIMHPEIQSVPEYVRTAESAGKVPGYVRTTESAGKVPGSHSVNREHVGLNYWGYTKSWYCAPKFSYCATGNPVREFRSLVTALHKAGIELIMEFAFPQNTDVSLALQCLSGWVSHYHVDGFRLLAEQSLADAAAKCPLLMQTKLISTYYDPAGYPDDRAKRLADMNDGFRNDCRRLLKGDENMAGAVAGRMRALPARKGLMNYIACHDGFTLMDLVSYDHKHNEEKGEQGRDGAQTEFSWNCGEEGPTKRRQILSLRLRQMKNALAMLFLAQGTPVLLAGDENGNTQGGNSNPYGIDSEVTWLDWKTSAFSRELTQFTADLIAFRKRYRTRICDEMADAIQISTGYPAVSLHGKKAWYSSFDYQSRSFGLMYCGASDGKEEYIYAAFNFHWDEQSLALPILPADTKWKQQLTSAESGCVISEREVILPGRTICILAGEKSTEEKSAGDKSTQEKSAGDKSTEEKSAGDKSAEKKSGEDKSAE